MYGRVSWNGVNRRRSRPFCRGRQYICPATGIIHRFGMSIPAAVLRYHTVMSRLRQRMWSGYDTLLYNEAYSGDVPP